MSLENRPMKFFKFSAFSLRVSFREAIQRVDFKKKIPKNLKSFENVPVPLSAQEIADSGDFHERHAAPLFFYRIFGALFERLSLLENGRPRRAFVSLVFVVAQRVAPSSAHLSRLNERKGRINENE